MNDELHIHVSFSPDKIYQLLKKRNTKLEKYPAVCPDQLLTYTLEHRNNEIITLSEGFFISANTRLTEIRIYPSL